MPAKRTTPESSRLPLTQEKKRSQDSNVHSIRSKSAFAAKRQGALEYQLDPKSNFPLPKLDPSTLMPKLPKNHLRTLSLFSGGGGLDLGFDLAGFEHVCSWELVSEAADTLILNRPEWEVKGGLAGDVRSQDWTAYAGQIDLIHGGPPCQPFSSAGKQLGPLDPRDMWPEFVRAVLEVKPRAFVAENVAALGHQRFDKYREKVILQPLGGLYELHIFTLRAEQFGVPQSRKRFFIVGFDRSRTKSGFNAPEATHSDHGVSELIAPSTMGIREALGLPDIGVDGISPTIRCSWTGPRGTTSILSSASASKTFAKYSIWPNGVALTREAAAAFPAKDGHYRLSVEEVALLQGFPDDWVFAGSTYMKLGQIGNSVAPPVAYNLAASIARFL